MSRKYTGLLIGITAFAVILLATDLEPGRPEVTATLAVAALMSIWWVTEAIPLSITALVPLFLFPMLGVLDGKAVSAVYINHIIFIFIGGFIMALAMEKWNLHKRIALKILLFTGVSPGRILLGFMLASAFLSMWISNTATTMMMIPIVLSIISSLEQNTSQKSVKHYSLGLLLAIAYSSSVGGMATLVGTPTNLVYPKILSLMYPGAPETSFSEWMVMALPITIIMLAAIWLIIYFMYRPRERWTGIEASHFRKQYKSLGPSTPEQKIVLILFICLAMLWIFRTGVSFDSFSIPGWSNLFGNPSYINDGTVAIFISVLLFIFPAPRHKGERIMNLETIKKLPWNIVLLFGGGFALALGFQSSGLATWIGSQLEWTSQVSPFIIMLSVVALMSFLTELTSNIASTQMLLPVFAGLAVSSGNNPILFMIPATLASSLAFMLPTATPPNAIVFGTNRLSIRTMIRTGFLLNMIGILVVAVIIYFMADNFLGIEPGKIPDWVNNLNP